MNKAYLDMVHCLGTTMNAANVNGMQMSVLERQKMAVNRQQEQLLQVQQQEESRCYNDLNMLSFLPVQPQDFRSFSMNCGSGRVTAGPTINGVVDRPIKVHTSTENGQVDFRIQQSRVTVEHLGVETVGKVHTPSYRMSYAIPTTTSFPPCVTVAKSAMTVANNNIEERENSPSEQKLDGETVRESSKKRKIENNLMIPKVGEAEGSNKTKRSKGCLEDEESKITVQNSNRNSSQSRQNGISGNNKGRKLKETSGDTSKDNCKASEVQKPDYIHVRAGRGQATDSHSLAERVRREKISERMRYLQDLVPGCNKITGKAGMLDEIINYVQSLQRQVEFLSMKLAAASPSLDFNVDDIIVKEVLGSCSSSLPAMGVSPDFMNPNYLHYNLGQQIDCGSEVETSSIDMGLQRSINIPVSMPETFFDTSPLNQITNYLQWDAGLQNIYSMEFQQGRSTSFPLQTFTGTIDASSLKMEI